MRKTLIALATLAAFWSTDAGASGRPTQDMEARLRLIDAAKACLGPKGVEDLLKTLQTPKISEPSFDAILITMIIKFENHCKIQKEQANLD